MKLIKEVEPITLIYYLDQDSTPLLEAAEWRTSHKGGAWCLAGSVDDIPLQIKKVIQTTKVEAGCNVQAKIPNISEHNPKPVYIRKLLYETGLTQIAIAKLIGVSDRSMREYTKIPIPTTQCPYPVQFALECLIDNRKGCEEKEVQLKESSNV